MIAQRATSYNSMEIDEPITMQTVFALLKQSVSIARWDCAVCGMIHRGSLPVQCDSCGSHALTQQSDIHREMNNRC